MHVPYLQNKTAQSTFHIAQKRGKRANGARTKVQVRHFCSEVTFSDYHFCRNVTPAAKSEFAARVTF